ncbi:MAG: pyridoxamine 5'-phosphate oxidase family protein [Bacteroidales bacterium]|jgi:uncharacterized protein YhbP (UPF0306 family)|nr:pyridoxamine 5'-phosphate oxidase family protein [Bacteroidales bacterium]
MTEFPQKITAFIQKHHVLTLATSANNQAWCANCFYAFDKKNQSLIFSSDTNTTHAQQALHNSIVAASIVLETKIVGKIQGLQCTGSVTLCEGDDVQNAQKTYFKKFPYAALAGTTLWRLHIHYAKLTDNTLGFGTKLIWQQ